MSSRVLPFFAAAILLTVGVTTSSACEYEKSRSAKAATASTAKKNAKTASATRLAGVSCSAKKGAATAASASACRVGEAATAVFASADAKRAHCAAAKAAAVAAGTEYTCSSKSAATAVAASESSCKASKGTRAAVAVAPASDRVDAVLAGAQCRSNSVKASKYAHSDCESCSDWSVCEGELAKAESQMQVVPLKNGVMYVFTAANPKGAGLVQAVLSSRNNRVKALMGAGDRATLCGQCKAFRGAIASGNLTREVVNIEGGSLMIMTSPDRQMVNQLYTLAGLEEHAVIEG